MRVLQKLGCLVLLLSLAFLLPCLSSALAENGQINGLVWMDKTPNGAMDADEKGFYDARITLEKRTPRGNAQTVGTTASAANGEFFFSSLPAGEYRLRVELMSDYRFTLHGQGSDALPAMGRVSYTPYFTLNEGETLSKRIGIIKSYCAVTVIAFEDENANGGRMLSEPLIRNVQVELLYEYGGETYVIAKSVTDRQGQVLFKDLSTATYRIRAVLPDNFVIGPMGQEFNYFYNCIRAGDDNTGLSDSFILEPKDSARVGVGMVRTGALNGKLWYDANFNGKWDADESGLTEALITLYSSSLDLSRTTHADKKGDYAFKGIQPGDYRLEFALPDGMVFTYPGVSLLSDIASSAGVTVSVQVDVTTSLTAVGAMPAAGLSFTFFQDDNQNGLMDPGEAPLPDISVTASQGGVKVKTVLTDPDGEALFTALRGGDTELSVQLPEGLLLSPAQGSPIAVSGAQDQCKVSLFLDGTQAGAQLTGAAVPASSISGILFEDPVNSGIYQDGCPLLSGFTVQAVSADGQIAAQAVTDENGAYTLSPLYPADYTVRFLLDDVYVASPFVENASETVNRILSQTPEYGETAKLTLAPGEHAAHMDGGVFRAGLVDGYVLIDESYESPFKGIAGVRVALLDQSGRPVSDYTRGETDEQGYFFIKGVLPGTYTLSYTLPENGMLTDPASSGKTWISDPFTSESGSQIHRPALRGLYTSSLSGLILHESVDDDTPFSALVTLKGHHISRVYEIHTQADGSYAFRDLFPDTYTLTVTLPENLVFGQLESSPVPAAADCRSSAEITFAMGDSLKNADILAAYPVSVSGTVYYDSNLSGVRDEDESPAEGRAVSLYMDGREAACGETDESGAFTLDHLVPGVYELRVELDENEEMGSLETGASLSVYQDRSVILPIMRYASVSGAVWSLDGTLNGVSGISVSLLDAESEAVLSSAETDETGAFTFTRLTPGNYSLTASLPKGYLFAREQDTAERDSFVQTRADGNAVSLPFHVPMGDDLSGIDIGMGAMGRIGDRAWLDENGNGMQDLGEKSMPGILIEMYRGGELIAQTVTDEYGRYSLSDLYPGEYEMRVTMPKELKTTIHQTAFPLVGSILPESKETTVSVYGVVVPSGGENLHCDLGFQLRKKGVYPAEMDQIPVKDWRPYSQR